MWYVCAHQKFKFQNVERCWILETVETVEKCLNVLLKLVQKWKKKDQQMWKWGGGEGWGESET